MLFPRRKRGGRGNAGAPCRRAWAPACARVRRAFAVAKSRAPAPRARPRRVAGRADGPLLGFRAHGAGERAREDFGAEGFLSCSRSPSQFFFSLSRLFVAPTNVRRCPASSGRRHSLCDALSLFARRAATLHQGGLHVPGRARVFKHPGAADALLGERRGADVSFSFFKWRAPSSCDAGGGRGGGMKWEEVGCVWTTTKGAEGWGT